MFYVAKTNIGSLKGSDRFSSLVALRSHTCWVNVGLIWMLRFGSKYANS